MKSYLTIPRWPGMEPPAISLTIPQRCGRLLRRLWLRLWPVLAAASLFIVFARIGPLLRLADPTAAVVDIGALSLVLLAAVALATFLAVSRRLVGLLWPVLRDYQRNHFSNNFKSLSPWQKITFYLVVFFGLLYAFVCCLAAVF